VISFLVKWFSKRVCLGSGFWPPKADRVKKGRPTLHRAYPRRYQQQRFALQQSRL